MSMGKNIYGKSHWILRWLIIQHFYRNSWLIHHKSFNSWFSLLCFSSGLLHRLSLRSEWLFLVIPPGLAILLLSSWSQQRRNVPQWKDFLILGFGQYTLICILTSQCICLVVFINNYNCTIGSLSLPLSLKHPEIRKNICWVDFEASVFSTVLGHFGTLNDILWKQFGLGYQHFIGWAYWCFMMPFLLLVIKARLITIREQNCLNWNKTKNK